MFLKSIYRMNHWLCVLEGNISGGPFVLRSQRLCSGMVYKEYTFRFLFLKGMHCVCHFLVVLEGYGSDQALLTQFCDKEHVSLINSDSEMYWSTHSLWWAYGFWRDYFCFWCLLAKVEDFAKSSSSIYKRQIWSLIWFYAF
jgi:hypothetical protein